MIHLPFLRLLGIWIILSHQAWAAELEAISFAESAQRWFLPLQEVAGQLHWSIKLNEAGECTNLNHLEVKRNSLRCLPDGTELADQALCEKAGAEISPNGESGKLTVRSGRYEFTLAIPVKRVEINLAHQELQAWQGARLVLRTRISSGRHGSTPAGDFRAGPFKARMHYSSRYHNAPMPWSVQVNGHIFIHGFTSVPDYPASHGCIRLPLTGRNPAKWFYEWVGTGTPVRIIKN